MVGWVDTIKNTVSQIKECRWLMFQRLGSETKSLIFVFLRHPTAITFSMVNWSYKWTNCWDFFGFLDCFLPSLPEMSLLSPAAVSSALWLLVTRESWSWVTSLGSDTGVTGAGSWNKRKLSKYFLTIQVTLRKHTIMSLVQMIMRKWNCSR